MKKSILWLQGMWSCISWFVYELIKEYCPDLNLYDMPTHPADYLWYAERVNGRAAMLAVIFIMQWELITHKSIWEFIGVY
jgi:hypothetical protein